MSNTDKTEGSMEDILLSGAKLSARVITEEEQNLFIERIEKAQHDLEESKRIDWAKLANTYITI